MSFFLNSQLRGLAESFPTLWLSNTLWQENRKHRETTPEEFTGKKNRVENLEKKVENFQETRVRETTTGEVPCKEEGSSRAVGEGEHGT